MNILTDKETIELALPALDIGFKLFTIDESKASIFDTFDRVNPEILIIKSSSLNAAVLKNIGERPWIKTIVINNGGDGINKLKEIAGGSFTEVEDLPFCNITAYSIVKPDENLACEIICPEGTDVDLNNFTFDASMPIKIFSSKQLIGHNRFCGFLPASFKPVAIKSSKYCIVNKKDFLNAVYAGSIPISDSSLIPATNLTKQEIRASMTNYHRLAEIFNKISLNSESNSIISKLEKYL